MDLTNLEQILFYICYIGYSLATVFFIVLYINKNEKWGNNARKILVISFIAHTISLIVRGINAGRVPLTNQFEFASSFAWGIALVFLIFNKKYQVETMGTFVSPILFLIISYAAMRDKSIKPLMPALDSGWLIVHVSLAIISYGAFAVASGTSFMFISKQKAINNGGKDNSKIGLEDLDLISYRAISLGFIFLSLVMITGAIWAESAWGRYWAWDPKETWSLITWIIYAIYLHLRRSRGWNGRRAAIFAIVGFISVVFTYVGVNTLLPSLHSYA
ncbi:c-type cytochrome biogenesis protein CcsB [uncultured Anaerococcus sp.]|uniref:c-type cytochrome biogenesis protein CcsB n=1 Tax=uncultured Anaerococcus sp. TaxID=293428 RepID=UPI002632BC0A|nr:c-type cytochrome biogenesis protein CcsB [uncultured Anaerococcus sp.]